MFYKQALQFLSIPQIFEKSFDVQKWNRSFTFSHDFGVFGKPKHIPYDMHIYNTFIRSQAQSQR